LRGIVLVEPTDGVGHECSDVARGKLGGTAEGFLGGDRTPDPLVRGAEKKPRSCAPATRPAPERVELTGRREAFETRWADEVGNERGAARRDFRVENVLGAKRCRRIGIPLLRLPPFANGGRLFSARKQRKAEMEAGDAAVRVLGDDLL
jgi:hypothetical protein